MSDTFHATEREVYSQYETLKGKFVYFLLAVDAACIALSVNRTTGMTLSLSMILIALAAVCWALIFFGGCKALVSQLSGISGNLELLRVSKGAHPVIGNDPQVIEWTENEMRRILDESAKNPVYWWKFQFRLLTLGAVLFIAWHITDMALGGSTLPPEC